MNRGAVFFGFTLSLALIAGCPDSNDPYGVTSGTVKRGTVGAVAAASGGGSGQGSTGSTTGAAATTTGTTTGSINGAGTCAPETSALGDCPSGQIELVANISNVCVPEVCLDSTLSVGDLDDGALTATTDANGYFHVCVAPGTLIAPHMSAPDHVTTNGAEINLESSIQMPANPGFPLLCTGLFGAFAAGVPPGVLNTDDSFVLVAMGSYSDAGAVPPTHDGGCGDLSGWSFTLSTADGTVLDAGVGYASGLGFDFTSAGTTSYGLAVFYNLDPTLGKVYISGSRPGNTFGDGGEVCPYLSRSLFQFTGAVTLQASEISIYPYIVLESG